MHLKLIPILADAMREYYGEDDLRELCMVFDIEPNSEETESELGFTAPRVAYLKFARTLIVNIEFGNNRLFLEAIVPSLVSRCERAIANTNWEKRDYHSSFAPRI